MRKRELVARVAASDLFQKAPRLREFLLYAADCTLENRLADVREQVIAERVFSRRPDFQGAQDSIVRAEARNLRKRLEAYFAAEGRLEPLVITMPKGSYALAFEPRPSENPVEPVTTIERDLQPSSAAAPAARRRFPLWFLGLVLIALGGLSVAYWRFPGLQLEQPLRVVKPVLPFSALFSENSDSLILTSDTGLLQIVMLAHRPITLNEYMARSYPDVPDVRPPDLIRDWNVYEFTDGREMSVAGLILRNYPQFAQHVELRSGHEVSLEDIKHRPVVLIGSPISNPWAQLFEDRLNFHCVLNGSGRILFRDNKGAEYPNADDIQHNRTYGRIAFLPGSSDTLPALLIAGTTAQSSQAAGEFTADPAKLTRTLRAIGIDPAGSPRFFEILLRSNSFVGGSTTPEVVAWKLTMPPEN